VLALSPLGAELCLAVLCQLLPTLSTQAAQGSTPWVAVLGAIHPTALAYLSVITSGIPFSRQREQLCQ